ncbi:hypothetical protein M8J76_006485 [Diaphorina citri]|nr:hypothetical protein M8J75_007327 [Diaphorina citri]KAI5736726.1 hypothetical protein M8J76_006485 [Diaphorina citri]KAI5743705.1 hypothetical protein M8J77_021254 [Diaphorina citri]
MSGDSNTKLGADYVLNKMGETYIAYTECIRNQCKIEPNHDSPPQSFDRRHYLAVSNVSRPRRMSEGNLVMQPNNEKFPGTSLQVPSQANLNRRKLSFPASFHSNLLSLNSIGDQPGGASSKRRFSNVSDVVSRKFSNTIGWRQQIPIQDIVTQGKTLVGQYMRCRLKRSGLFSRKCGLQRLRSVASLPGGFVIREVFPRLLTIGQELERLHPKLYSGVTRQASAHNGVVFITEKTVNSVLIQVARELSRQDLTWAKVVSLYCVAGGLAVDCVRQGHPEYLPSLIDTMGEILEEEIALWIGDNGGWTSLCNYCRPPTNELSLGVCIAMFSAAVTSIVIIVLSLRWFGKVAFF